MIENRVNLNAVPETVVVRPGRLRAGQPLRVETAPSAFTNEVRSSPSSKIRSLLADTRVLLTEQERQPAGAEEPLASLVREDLSLQAEAKIRQLQQRDREVYQHERAHSSAGAGLTGPPSYQYITGPDGRQYAVGGEVSVNLVKARTPEATIARMDQIIHAALAPQRPSAMDRSVALHARQIKLEAEIVQNELQAAGEEINQQSFVPTSDVTNRGIAAYDQAAELHPRSVEPVTQSEERIIGTDL